MYTPAHQNPLITPQRSRLLSVRWDRIVIPRGKNPTAASRFMYYGFREKYYCVMPSPRTLVFIVIVLGVMKKRLLTMAFQHFPEATLSPKKAIPLNSLAELIGFVRFI